MRKILALGALVVLLCITAGGSVERRGETEWSSTCLLYSEYRAEDVCEGVAPPKVKYEEMEPGLQGYYDGGETIFINKEVRGKNRSATMIHEMVHYIDTKYYSLPIPGPAVLICMSEEGAWFIEGVWWGIQGQPEKARADWWMSYPHCWQWYAPDDFMRYIQGLIETLDPVYPSQ